MNSINWVNGYVIPLKIGLWLKSARRVDFKRQAEAEKGREDQVMKYYQK